MNERSFLPVLRARIYNLGPLVQDAHCHLAIALPTVQWLSDAALHVHMLVKRPIPCYRRHQEVGSKKLKVCAEEAFDPARSYSQPVGPLGALSRVSSQPLRFYPATCPPCLRRRRPTIKLPCIGAFGQLGAHTPPPLYARGPAQPSEPARARPVKSPSISCASCALLPPCVLAC